MKIVLTMDQERFIDGIPEIESLARKYIAIDRLLTKFKTEPDLVEKLAQLKQKVEELTNTLYKDIMLDVIQLKPEKIDRIFTLKNPELDAASFNTFIHCYKLAKMNYPWDALSKVQRKLFKHIQDLLEVIQNYRYNYNIPKKTILVLEALQKLEETANTR